MASVIRAIYLIILLFTTKLCECMQECEEFISKGNRKNDTKIMKVGLSRLKELFVSELTQI